MPRAQRQDPLHLQISGHFKREILEGRLHPGDRLPPIRSVSEEWGVGQNTAQRAFEQLRTDGLVRTTSEGTFVDGPRNILGPQQRLNLTGFPASEETEMLAAEVIPAPAYIIPILGLPDSLPSGTVIVIRREWVTRQPDGTPVMLSVSWTPPWVGPLVPELLELAPLPDPRGAAQMIADRTRRDVEWGKAGFECRPARDDGRELVHLRLQPGASVLAGVYLWASGDDVLEYGEYVLPPGRVIESGMEP